MANIQRCDVCGLWTDGGYRSRADQQGGEGIERFRTRWDRRDAPDLLKFCSEEHRDDHDRKAGLI
jgi:hypothetical protein